MIDLSEEDFDALYAVIQEEMPRISRDLFPKILEQLVGQGVLTIDVTDNEITVTSPAAPGTGVFRVERKRRLH